MGNMKEFIVTIEGVNNGKTVTKHFAISLEYLNQYRRSLPKEVKEKYFNDPIIIMIKDKISDIVNELEGVE